MDKTSVGISAAMGFTGAGMGGVVSKNVARFGGRAIANGIIGVGIGAAGQVAKNLTDDECAGTDWNEGLGSAAAWGGGLGAAGSAIGESAGRGVSSGVNNMSKRGGGSLSRGLRSSGALTSSPNNGSAFGAGIGAAAGSAVSNFPTSGNSNCGCK